MRRSKKPLLMTGVPLPRRFRRVRGDNMPWPEDSVIVNLGDEVPNTLGLEAWLYSVEGESGSYSAKGVIVNNGDGTVGLHFRDTLQYNRGPFNIEPL